MDTPWLEVALRWIHVVAGVLWIGLLYFFNWVNTQFAPKLSAEAKREALPIVLPRTLYFFRWGAAFTWISGILLLGVLYHMNPGAWAGGDDAVANDKLYSLALVLGGVFVYDLLWKKVSGMAGVAISLALAACAGYVMTDCFNAPTGTAMIHVGALF